MEPLSPRARHRAARLRTAHRRRVLGVALVAAVSVALIAVIVGTTLVGRTTPVPSLSVDHRSGDILATGRSFAPSTSVDVVARFDGGSGSIQLTTDGSGGFAVAFRPPAGFAGTLHVSATAGAVRVDASVVSTLEVRAASSPADRHARADGVRSQPPVVPITGAPVTASVPVPDSGLPRYPVPAAIRADCSVDVSGQLNEWLATVPDGSQIDFPQQACYRVDGSVTLTSRNNLVIEGNGSTFKAETKVATPETNRAQWRFDYGTGITIRDMTLVGVNPKAEFSLANQFDHNLFIRGTKHVTVQNVHGRNAYGDFIAIAHGMDGVTIPTDINISNVSADTIGRMGISCVACDGVSVDNSVFNNIAYHVFDLEIEGNNWPGRNVRYTNNVIGAHGWAFFSVGTPYQTYNNDLSNVYIAGNVMTEPGSTTDECFPSLSFRDTKIDARNVVIENNSIVSRTDGILVKRVSGVTIRNNSVSLVGPTCGSPVGITTTAVTGTDVRDNRFTGYQSHYTRE